ncbi:hypothetical protein [Metapseudomonas otitidis]|nr:hypothetical protein [Pseudomonas otitidis]MDG9784870.1 hypothetical protein [Pseudomonas otitidis]
MRTQPTLLIGALLAGLATSALAAPPKPVPYTYGTKQSDACLAE